MVENLVLHLKHLIKPCFLNLNHLKLGWPNIRLIHRISRASTVCTKSRCEHDFGNNIRWPLRLGKGLYKPLTITAEDIEIQDCASIYL